MKCDVSRDELGGPRGIPHPLQQVTKLGDVPICPALRCEAGQDYFQFPPGLHDVLELILAQQQAPLEGGRQQVGRPAPQVGAIAGPHLDQAEQS